MSKPISQRDHLFTQIRSKNYVLRKGDRMRRTNAESASSLEWFPMPVDDVGRKASYFVGGGFEVQRRKIHPEPETKVKCRK